MCFVGVDLVFVDYFVCDDYDYCEVDIGDLVVLIDYLSDIICGEVYYCD